MTGTTSTMPSLEQIRAARALLGWSQHDLAEKADLSQTGIARIENGTNKPNSKTLEKICAAFDAADIEFLGTTGLRKRTVEIRTLRGSEGFRKLMDEVYEAMRAGDKDICLFNGMPMLFKKWLGAEWYEAHAKRMQECATPGSIKIIVRADETHFIADAFAEYRGFPEHMFKEKTFYAYGDKLAFINFMADDVHIGIMDQRVFSESFRVLFNIAWEKVAKPFSK